MHGEYKTPGGKLVVVDFSVANDALRGVEVSGDFFLYPDDALATITGALEGAPSDATEEQLAARIRGALAPGVTMLGFSSEAIGRAVRRGLGEA